MSDPDGILATPLRTVPRTADDDGVPAIAALVTEHDAVEVVVGLPVTLAGTEGLAAAQARDYAERLASAIMPIPVKAPPCLGLRSSTFWNRAAACSLRSASNSTLPNS